jgi:hypothetical protein
MNDKNIFTPFIGLHDIRFGMNRITIREILGNNYKTFRRGAVENTTDFYDEKGIFVEYDLLDNCNAIEFVNTTNLTYDFKNLFEYSYSTLVDIFTNKSLKADIEENKSVTYLDLGFGASKIDNSDKIEAIIIFSKDYWKG